MNDYISQIPNIGEEQQVSITSTTIEQSGIPVIEVDDELPDVTSSNYDKLFVSDTKEEVSYLSPQKVKVRRYVLRK